MEFPLEKKLPQADNYRKERIFPTRLCRRLYHTEVNEDVHSKSRATEGLKCWC